VLVGLSTGITNIVNNAPEKNGPMAPPIILIVEVVAETVPVASRGVAYKITFGIKVRKTPPKAKNTRKPAVFPLGYICL